MLVYLSILSPCLGIYFGITDFKAKGRSSKIIAGLLCIAFLCDSAMFVMGSMKINNLFIAHIYGFFEAVLLGLFFMSIMQKRRHYIAGVLISYCLYYIGNSVLFEPISSFNAVARAIEAIIMLIFCLLFFYHIFQEEADIFIERSPDFWFVIGILIYFSGAFFSFLLATDILSTTFDNFYGSWILHNVSNTLKNLLLAFGLWQSHKAFKRVASS